MKRWYKRLRFRLTTKWLKWKDRKKTPAVKNDECLPLHLRSGRKGENYAAELLETKGYRIVKRNYAVGKSELDIVAENEDTFVICEVKTRIQEYGAPARYGPPSRAVTKEKRRHLLAATSLFCRKHQDAEKTFRFDIIEVYLKRDLSLGHIEHFENLWMK